MSGQLQYELSPTWTIFSKKKPRDSSAGQSGDYSLVGRASWPPPNCAESLQFCGRDEPGFTDFDGLDDAPLTVLSDRFGFRAQKPRGLGRLKQVGRFDLCHSHTPDISPGAGQIQPRKTPRKRFRGVIAGTGFDSSQGSFLS